MIASHKLFTNSFRNNYIRFPFQKSFSNHFHNAFCANGKQRTRASLLSGSQAKATKVQGRGCSSPLLWKRPWQWAWEGRPRHHIKMVICWTKRRRSSPFHRPALIRHSDFSRDSRRHRENEIFPPTKETLQEAAASPLMLRYMSPT